MLEFLEIRMQSLSDGDEKRTVNKAISVSENQCRVKS